MRYTTYIGNYIYAELQNGDRHHMLFPVLGTRVYVLILYWGPTYGLFWVNPFLYDITHTGI